MGRQKYLTAIILGVGSLLMSITPACVAQTRCVSALISSCVYATSSAAGWMVRPGTISDAMTKSDGTHVYLDAVVIDKIRAKQFPGYLVVYEPFSPKDRLIVLTQPAPELRLGQTVDVEGTITTLGNGYRAIINPTIYGYLDKEGRLMLRGGTIKGFLAPTPWPWKTDLTVEAAATQSPADGASVEPDPAPDDDPTYCPTISDIFEACAAAQTASARSGGIRVQAYYEHISELDGLGDGALVELQCKGILAADTETIDSIEYKYVDIADDPPAGSIRAYYAKAVDVSASDRVNLITGQIQRVDTTAVICVDTGPGYDTEIPEGRLVTASPGSIAYALTQVDGATATLDDKVVTANQADFPGALYVQEPADSGYFGGIRVRYSGTVRARGDLVAVSGDMAKGTDGEREIVDASVTPAGQGTVPEPLGMINRDLGGGAFNVYTPGVSDPEGSGGGLYNKGSLVRVWGKVTAVDAANKFFYMDDGAALEDSSENKGVKVSWAWSPSDLVMPALATYMSVVGISGSDTAGSENYYRVLRPRNQADVYWPTDTTAPTVTITNPPGAHIHLASGQTSAQLAGTATDDVSGVASVEVGFTDAQGDPETEPTTYFPATYSTTTHVWTYEWGSPTTLRVWVKATDYAGHAGTTHPVVYVYPVTVKYVRPNGAGTKTGSSWINAEDKVADALTAATSGTEIWVAQGTYYERITLKSGVALYGGFAATETYREQRNWAANTTVLDGSQAGSVVTVPTGATSATAISGFTIEHGLANYGGGIYFSYWASATIAHNIIQANRAYTYGGGMITGNWSLTVVGNILVNNKAGYGAGIYWNQTAGGQIANNTIIGNVASGNVGGICLVATSPTLSNNIVAFNVGGGIYKSGGSPTLSHNCVYGNATYDYSGLSPGTGDLSADPLIPNIAAGDWHIAWGSPCRDAGDDSVVLPTDRDIDREARRNGPIDVGADETTECWRFYITLIRDATQAPIGTPVKVTACVFDSVEMNQPEAGYQVDVSVDVGEIVSVTRSGSRVTLPALAQSTYGITDADGNVDAYVTTNTQGFLNVTCTITQCELPASRTAGVYFGPVVDLVFLIDATGSTDNGAEMSDGIKATVDYLYEQLQAQGRALRVAGIKFSDYYPVNPAVGNNRAELRDFAVLPDTEARDAFKNWVDEAGLGGGAEYQLDILMFAKDMSPAALPGLYIALATDEDSDSTLDMQTVANALDQSNAIVFIDPKYAALVPYYQPLAVNGGAIEQESGNLGTFTFQRMRQAILGTP